jgi:hypothetical protein
MEEPSFTSEERIVPDRNKINNYKLLSKILSKSKSKS